MDPKLRPSFQDIVKDLEEILARLKVEEVEHEDVQLSADNDKTIPKGKSTAKNCAAEVYHCSFASSRFTVK